MLNLEKRQYHLIYPHQLFAELLSFPSDTVFVLIEDPLFFGDKKYPLSFHKKKLVLHRASMKSLEDVLKKKGFITHYLEYKENPVPSKVKDFLRSQNSGKVSVYDPTDYVLKSRLDKSFRDSDLQLEILESPNFLTPKNVLEEFFKGKKKFYMNSFYIFQRKRLKILVDNDGNPEGGKWSYDTENRKKLPKDIRLPEIPKFIRDKFVEEAIEYVQKNFPQNPGSVKDFNYPINYEQAKLQLEDFVEKRLENFGVYEDAISKDESYLFHSLLSAPLNIGLLSPQEVLNETMRKKNSVSLNSLEGFIRQIIGWREFMRAVYLIKGSEIRNRNFLKHTNTLNSAFYTGETGIEPIDNTIKKLLVTAYSHHIERLMILGNFMMLLEIHPAEIYKWFMEMYIDAYDWVMVPNVYAMSQFSDGGTITTKPYFSSSNYVLKMSDYPKGEWCKVWDALFYNFLKRNAELISKNPRLGILIKNLNKMDKQKILEMHQIIEEFGYSRSSLL